MILDQYGNPAYHTRKFASAANRYDRAAPVLPVYDGDFSKLIPNLDRITIVSASRAIFQDYGPITGALIQKADHVVGRAWSPKFKGQDIEWGEMAQKWLEDQWYGNCDIRGRAWDFRTLLWLDSVALDRDGDFLIVLTESESGYPLTQRICVNRIGMRSSDKDIVESGAYKGAKISHGVITNKFGRPIAYRILGDSKEDDKDMPANQVIHCFDPLWHDQVRGLPSYAGAIKMVYGSMTAHEREQMNQNVRSSISLVEYNENGGPDFDDPTVTLGRQVLDGNGAVVSEEPSMQHYGGGMIKYFRSNSGGKIESIDTNQPGDMWDRFQDRVIRMASSGINWPYELMWKGSDINAALVRNIQERARISVEDRQDVIANHALFAVRYAVAKAIKTGLLPQPANQDDWWRWSFQMPRKFSIDQGRDAQQRREDYRTGLRNRTEIHEEEGKDAAVMEDIRISEVIRRERKIDAAVAQYQAETGRVIDRRLFHTIGPNDPASQNDIQETGPSESAQQREGFETLKAKFDAYGVAVRAGAITPATEDEILFRQEADLPAMSNAVQKAWQEDEGYRRPMTLVQKIKNALTPDQETETTEENED